MKIYIASSWKNYQIVRQLSGLLQAEGHEVYDFTDEKKHFAFNALDIPRFTGKSRDEIDWLEFNECRETMMAFKTDKAGLDWADAVLMVLPCGRSAHIEAGYAVGQGKPLIIYGDLPKGEFETMYGFAFDCIRNTDSTSWDVFTLSTALEVAVARSEGERHAIESPEVRQ